jgi:hypothetical protein
MTVLLTDDEVVAISLEGRLTWPTPLPSVELDESGIARSQQLGLRSLVVRGLLDSAARPPGVAPEISDIVRTVAEAPSWVAAYVASTGSPTKLAGDSTYVYRAEPSWLLDAVSPGGIHQIGATTNENAEELIVALAKNVFDFGFRGDRTDAALFIGNSESPEWVKICAGELELGHFSEGAFVPISSVSDWTGAEIASVFASA